MTYKNVIISEKSTQRKKNFLFSSLQLSVALLFIVVSILFILSEKHNDYWKKQHNLTSQIAKVQTNLIQSFRYEQEDLVKLTSSIRADNYSIEQLLEQPKLFFSSATQLFYSHKSISLIGFIEEKSAKGFFMTSPRGKPVAITEQAPFFNLAVKNAIDEVFKSKLRSHSRPYLNINNQYAVSFIEPILHNRNIVGYLFNESIVKDHFEQATGKDLLEYNHVALLDRDGNTISGTDSQKIFDVTVSFLPSGILTMEPVITNFADNKLSLVILPKDLRYDSLSHWLLIILFVLSLISIIFLLLNIKRELQYSQSQNILLKELSFRRELSSSMLVGICALSMQGVTSFVNRSFCRILGIEEEDILGKKPPAVYWNKNIRKQANHDLNKSLVTAGIKTKIYRPDGKQVDVQFFISPFKDYNGIQTGWMLSVVDISASERIREQLTASFLQFTTILEALDSSVSVVAIGQSDLVFSNKMYKKWFGDSSSSHFQLLRTGATTSSNKVLGATDAQHAYDEDNQTSGKRNIANTEVFVPALNRWLEVRSRYLTWTDGLLAQMVIASDITERRLAQEQSAIQAERIAQQNRLITTGEIASSISHELNQPLAAINNYCNGLISRVKTNRITQESLLDMLEKTAHQAKRAGKIIQRIRVFIRRHETNCTLVSANHMIEEAIETTAVELMKRQVKLINQANPDLPKLFADPILIEQVLTNIIKNAAEAIDKAQRPENQRIIRIQAENKIIENSQAVEFCVYDNGTGLPEEIKEQIFESFFTTKSDGMGIGLNLCRSIIESHHGRISVNNLYNSKEEITGCCFAFWIPINRPTNPLLLD